MATTKITGAATQSASATGSAGIDATGNAGNVQRRLVQGKDRSPDATPKTPDELIDCFVKGFDFFTREQMLEAIDSGMFQIYQLTPRAWALIEFVPTRYGKTLNILTVAGSRDEWEPGWIAVEKIARSNQCDMIYSVGHPGWKRFMEERGFSTEPMMKMVKVLQ